jgi:anhydro-N-acetylmuramic acid kinase
MNPTESGSLYIGLMSGTSLDGIDAALVAFPNDGSTETSPSLIAARTFPLAAPLREELLSLCQPGANEIERLGRADRTLGQAFGQAVVTLLEQSGVPADAVTAIGSHGQTVRHRPHATDSSPAFTLQIGDPCTIAEMTGITTVADFRRRDIAAGGQGAPLVPAFHRAVFGGARNRVILNIGGMANITALAAHGSLPVLGFDTGPGNTLLDSWIAQKRQLDCDRDGAWAASGQTHSALLATLLRDAYFCSPPPKSTGREYFNLAWLQNALDGHPGITPEDVQATLAELTATSIADAIRSLPFTANEVFVCGGGARNLDLMQRLERLLHPRQLGHTGQLGIDPEWVEAAAFAWLARETLAGRAGNEPAVTGACGPRILGGIYPAG